MDEPALIAAAKEGDREAFNQLVVHYQSMAYNVAYRVLEAAFWPKQSPLLSSGDCFVAKSAPRNDT